MMEKKVSTGHPGMDQVLDSLRIGDNVVWQIDRIEDYHYVVQYFVQQARRDRRDLVYFRFGLHDSLISDQLSETDHKIEVVQLDYECGFELFTNQIFQTITRKGQYVFYIFDCLTDLLEYWSSDLMIGNFFKIICPYLFELDTVAYFALMRGQHAFDAVARIRETTQVLLDLYRDQQDYYLYPLKVWQRYSTTMFMPNLIKENEGLPLTSSADISAFHEFVETDKNKRSDYAQSMRQIDYWDRLFQKADQLTRSGRSAEYERLFEPLLRRVIGQDGQIVQLAREYFTLEDLVAIAQRQIGTGKIGGKAVGLLLARKMITSARSDQNRIQEKDLEGHDSYFIGSDLYYTYIVQNGWWKIRVEQKQDEGFFEKAKELKQKLLTGKFSDQIRDQFQLMLDYFGQSPIIVRSSSLLEDNYGNAFAGKYESIFCANQGSPEERLEALEQAIRIVYASTMDEQALQYRIHKGLQHQDEQMALLIQRVSGNYHGHYFYPLLAGVGLSNNLYVWDSRMDPDSGMLRLVYGLGTRAVDRVSGDYPRIVALDQPTVSTHTTKADEKAYSQHAIDVIDVLDNRFKTLDISRLNDLMPDSDIDKVGERDWEGQAVINSLNIKNRESWIINFKNILNNPDLIGLIRNILDILEKAYAYPVDIEFTINQTINGEYKFNLLQCRPLQTKVIGRAVDKPETYDKQNVIVRSKGHFMGGNVDIDINHIIYVNPEKYCELTEQKKFQVARIIGQINERLNAKGQQGIALIGPGRWGTSTPSMGVPVSFSEISTIKILVEVSFESAGMIPEISYGSHFFQDLVELDIFYMAILPQKPDTVFRTDLFSTSANQLATLLPGQEEYENIVNVIDLTDHPLKLYSDIVSQEVIVLKV